MLMALAAGVTAVSNSPITSLRRAAGATDAAALAELLHRLALDASLVDADCDESGRSALHHACWRGSVRNVERLLDLGCDIDAWSTGLHSYGKTPIFYATTRCRDDVVELLLSRGARLRILNNKGQSVLSLASTHLSPRVLAKVEAAEAAEGGLPPRWIDRLRSLPPGARPLVCAAGWVDFQSSHPDHQTYGDLDPRFYLGKAHPDGRKCTEPDADFYSGEGGAGGPGRQTPHIVGGLPVPPTGHARHTVGGSDLVTRLAVDPTSREGRRLHKHMPGARSLAWFPPARGDTVGGRGGGDTAGRGTGGLGARRDTAGGADARRRKSGDLATGQAPVGGVGRPGAATTTAVLEAAIEEALPMLLCRLGSGRVGGSLGDGETTGVDGVTPAAVSEVACLASDVVAALSQHKGAWLTAAALRIGRAGAPPSLLRAAAEAASQGGGSHSQLCRRMLMQAANAPSEAEAAAAAVAGKKALADRLRRASARATAAALAESRCAVRVGATPMIDAPAPRVVWVDSVGGVRQMEEVVGQAGFVGVDTEWKEARVAKEGVWGPGEQEGEAGGAGAGGGRVGEAVLATVQVAVQDEDGGELAFVCHVPWGCGSASAMHRGHAVGKRPLVLHGGGAIFDPPLQPPFDRTDAPFLQGEGPSPPTLQDEDPAYASALSAALRRLLVQPKGWRAVGFAFSADAQKIARWMQAAGGGGGAESGGSDGGGDRGGGDVLVSECEASASLSSEAALAATIRRSTIDIQRLAEDAGLGSRAQAPSLQACCEHWLAHRLSKQEQCSDWGARPLSQRQVRYAATDASACLRLLEAMRHDWGGNAGVPLTEGL